ncbi:hypothetical protein [Calothrix sp. UHCC 0171]|uniref:hypothetical protein n=1 Tax=Calothrix sp. UHCC 0171 TaxID=3110245 RepID=UPI002B1EB3CB|nr:hypothetical protein [Calothrix sp. UHCC 0171]MEA5572861.1 hypothetical protein [Calothrix sp. UHCC 0171]
MSHLQKVINITLLTTVLFAPAAMAQQQSLRTEIGGLEQHVPCQDRHGKPIPCPWQKPIKDNVTTGDTSAEKKANPCNPKKGQPVDTKACRDYINGNPKPPTQPKS